MIANSLVMQIITLVVAVVVVFTYIQPTFAGINQKQEQIEVLQREKSTIESVQVRLDYLSQKLNSISDQDRRKISTFLPETLDEVKVLRDIDIMTKTPGRMLNLISLEYLSGESLGSTQSDSQSESLPLREHKFSLSLIASYEQLKDFLLILERNNYPLEIDTMKISMGEGGFLNIDITLITYSIK